MLRPRFRFLGALTIAETARTNRPFMTATSRASGFMVVLRAGLISMNFLNI